jgi:hypothetical protein
MLRWLWRDFDSEKRWYANFGGTLPRVTRYIMTMSRVVRIMHVTHNSGKEPRCEPDSHAETTVASSNMCLLEATGQTVDIAAYSE